jgi:hypothetical protein
VKTFNFFTCIIVGLFYFNFCLGQNKDNYWPLGYASNSPNPLAGGLKLTFPSNFALLDTHSRPMWFVYTNAAISNDSGSLLFYTNGVYIANALDDTMLNGSGLNPSFYTMQFYNTGLRLPQAALILPFPGSINLHHLFHMTEDIPAPYFKPKYLYNSVVDMNGDNGLGAVLVKNDILITDTLYPSCLTACRHANGRDWWLLVARWGANIGYYTMLITPDTIKQTNYQTFPFDGLQGGQACFSPDGSKYIISYWWGVAFFDFDRCSGSLSYIASKVFADSAFCLGASISPNSRYAYITHGGFELLQYDLQAGNIVASEQLVATYDGFQAPAGWNTNFWMHQIAPDGKIYVNTTSTTMALHTIELPDNPGIACNVQQHSLLLPHFNATLPNFPNYNLGRLQGSPCDTLQWAGVDEQQHDFRFRIYPNPLTSNSLHIGYLLPQNKSGVFSIYDVTGKVVFKFNLPQWSNEQQLTLPKLANGVYSATIISNSKRVSKIIALMNE